VNSTSLCQHLLLPLLHEHLNSEYSLAVFTAFQFLLSITAVLG